MPRYYIGAVEPSRYVAVQPGIGWDLTPMRTAAAVAFYLAFKWLDELAFHKRLEGALHLLKGS